MFFFFLLSLASFGFASRSAVWMVCFLFIIKLGGIASEPLCLHGTTSKGTEMFCDAVRYLKAGTSHESNVGQKETV